MGKADPPATSTTAAISANKGAKVVDIRLIDRSGRYHLGLPLHPPIHHDNGFLDQFQPEAPTVADRVALAEWRAKLEGAEAFRPDLADATAAYRHFLDGNGRDRTFSYERYVRDDASGKKTLQSLLNDFEFHAEVIGHNREHFAVTSDAYAIGGDKTFFPYPATENWQKAIGAHYAWISAEVEVRTDPTDLKDVFEATVTVHVEDRYNFNPGMHDIATGVPDSANGRFEITGLAHQYMNYATLVRHVSWKEGDGKPAQADATTVDRNETRRPNDNRRLRNRI
jgi:hypothetical protein